MLKYSPLTHQHQTRHHRSVENPSLWLKLLINFILQLNCTHQPILQSTLWCMFYRSNNMKGFFILYIITLILQTTFQYHLGLVATFCHWRTCTTHKNSLTHAPHVIHLYLLALNYSTPQPTIGLLPPLTQTRMLWFKWKILCFDTIWWGENLVLV